MKIALIGANGFVGKAIARELLDRGHFVTAISRHPEILEAGGAGDRTGGAVAGGSRGPAAGGAGDKTGGAVAGGSRGPAVGGAGDRTGGAVAGG